MGYANTNSRFRWGQDPPHESGYADSDVVGAVTGLPLDLLDALSTPGPTVDEFAVVRSAIVDGRRRVNLGDALLVSVILGLASAYGGDA